MWHCAKENLELTPDRQLSWSGVRVLRGEGWFAGAFGAAAPSQARISSHSMQKNVRIVSSVRSAEPAANPTVIHHQQ
jgi:hypothetical protein